MIDDRAIDYKREYNQVTTELSKLKQDYAELKNDRDYIYSLLDVEFEKGLKLKKENEQLKEKLKIYHKIANCTNCNYHDYDWFDDGSYDEFEVCRKGNDVTEGICEEWREL